MKKIKYFFLKEFSVEASNIDGEENTKEETDLRDIEFKLMHNLDELQVNF